MYDLETVAATADLIRAVAPATPFLCVLNGVAPRGPRLPQARRLLDDMCMPVCDASLGLRAAVYEIVRRAARLSTRRQGHSSTGRDRGSSTPRQDHLRTGREADLSTSGTDRLSTSGEERLFTSREADSSTRRQADNTTRRESRLDAGQAR